MRPEFLSGLKAKFSPRSEPQAHYSFIGTLCHRVLPPHRLRRRTTTHTTHAETQTFSGNVAPAGEGTSENSPTRVTQPEEGESLSFQAQPEAAPHVSGIPQATQAESNSDRNADADSEYSSQEPDDHLENDKTPTVPSLLDRIKFLNNSLNDSEMAVLRLKRRVIQLNKTLTTLLGNGKDFSKIQCPLCGREGPVETQVEQRAWLSFDTEERREQGRMYWLTEDDMPHIIWGEKNSGEGEVDRQEGSGRVVGFGVDWSEAQGSVLGGSGNEGVDEEGDVWREGDYWIPEPSREVETRDENGSGQKLDAEVDVEVDAEVDEEKDAWRDGEHWLLGELSSWE